MGKLLVEIINRHNLFIATDVPYTFKRQDNTGKSTIDLSFIRGISNVSIKTKEFELIKTGHLAVEIHIQDSKKNTITQPKFKTKDADWTKWQKHLSPHFYKYINSFPEYITEEEKDNQANILRRQPLVAVP